MSLFWSENHLFGSASKKPCSAAQHLKSCRMRRNYITENRDCTSSIRKKKMKSGSMHRKNTKTTIF